MDERQRRLALGAEARVLGHGGIKLVARAAGVSAVTVSKEAAELEAGNDPSDRVRQPGGGRKPQRVKDSGLVAALLALVDPDERGDPMSPLRWTTKSTRTLAVELTADGHPVSAWMVANMLHEQGFSLQANSKQVEGTAHPDRDAQFVYLNAQSAEHIAAGCPVISVDTKKKELVGNYKNAGQQWRPAAEPARVNLHDFPDTVLGKANPYGIYHVAANQGWVSVGTDHYTAGFAVETIRRPRHRNRPGHNRVPPGMTPFFRSSPAKKRGSDQLDLKQGEGHTYRRAPASGTKSSTGSSVISR